MNIADQLKPHFSNEMWSVFEKAAKLGDKKKQKVALVGGVVRDLLVGRAIGDADIMIEHPAKELVSELAKTLKAEMTSYERFFTFTITLPSGKKIDIVTAREETYSAPARLPDVTPSSIEKDLKRRDFTINAIACLLNQKLNGKTAFGTVLDPYGGTADIKRKIIRTLHESSFLDDPTRIYRAARFVGRLGFSIESQTERDILDCIKRGIPERLSPVRRRHEFEMILKEANPTPALKLLKEWKALVLLHPAWGEAKEKVFQFTTPPVLIERLAEWFAPWKAARTQSIMTDLAFEKTIKAQVLSKLIQSPTTS